MSCVILAHQTCSFPPKVPPRSPPPRWLFHLRNMTTAGFSLPNASLSYNACPITCTHQTSSRVAFFYAILGRRMYFGPFSNLFNPLVSTPPASLFDRSFVPRYALRVVIPLRPFEFGRSIVPNLNETSLIWTMAAAIPSHWPGASARKAMVSISLWLLMLSFGSLLQASFLRYPVNSDGDSGSNSHGRDSCLGSALGLRTLPSPWPV